MKKIKILLVALSCLLLSTPSWAQTKGADKILGTYLVQMPKSENTAKMKIDRHNDGSYYARVVWASHMQREEDKNTADVNNPDPKLRTRKVKDIDMASGLKFKDGEWINGKWYMISSGKTFDMKVKLADNGKDLKVRYYKKSPAIGVSQEWKRVNN